METFTKAKRAVADPQFATRRLRTLRALDLTAIDGPIADIIRTFSSLPHCFTLQCCWGHFVHAGQGDPHGIEPLARYSEDTEVEYRLAYLAICVENSRAGRRLRRDLRRVARIDPQTVQFGSAEWFWHDHVNSYVLQVEPTRCQLSDTAMVSVAEALHLQTVKAHVFEAVREVSLRHAGAI